MSKNLVVYYSHTANNKFLAEKIAQELQCDCEKIEPSFNAFFWQMILSNLNLTTGLKNLQHNIADYDNIILCGPIWMGNLITPLRSFLKKYHQEIKNLYFVTCCGSKDENKDDKFGYNSVFTKVKDIIGDKCVQCTAFSINLVIPEDVKNKDEAMMKARLTNETYQGEIKKKLEEFVKNIQ
ncbi:MAG: flavodoxin family protein [Patescibacteria group bacterium]